MSLLSSLTSRFSVPNFYGMAINILLLVLVCGAIIALVYFYYNRKNYINKVIILSERGGNAIRFFEDKAAFFKDNKKQLWTFELKGRKEKLPPPPNECLLVDENGDNVVFFYENAAGELHPCAINISKPTEEIEITMPDGTKKKVPKISLRIIEPDVALWAVHTKEELMKAYSTQSFWEKYGGQILFATFAVLTLVLIFMVLKKVDVVKEAAEMFKEATNVLRSSSVVVNSTAP